MVPNLPKFAVIGFLLIGAAALGYGAISSPSQQATTRIKQITVPPLSQVARAGSKVYDENCAACHGVNGTGTEKGPPLVHDIYNPGHHADEAFYRAVRNGVQRHHWHFGDMPPQPQMDRLSTQAAIQYVRELQAANGIVYREHRM